MLPSDRKMHICVHATPGESRPLSSYRLGHTRNHSFIEPAAICPADITIDRANHLRPSLRQEPAAAFFDRRERKRAKRAAKAHLFGVVRSSVVLQWCRQGRWAVLPSLRKGVPFSVGV